MYGGEHLSDALSQVEGAAGALVLRLLPPLSAGNGMFAPLQAGFVAAQGKLLMCLLLPPSGWIWLTCRPSMAESREPQPWRCGGGAGRRCVYARFHGIPRRRQ
jgi:hypothetical protein